MKKLLLFIACATVAMSCTEDKKESKLSPAAVELKYSKTHQVNPDQGVAMDWSSSDNFVASVSSSGLVTAEHIGQAEISATVEGKRKICKVTVSPTYNSYQEPIMDWGASRETIKKKEKRVIETEDDEAIAYKEPRTTGVMYIFDNNKLTISGVLLPTTFDPEELVVFLNERYQIAGKVDDNFLWIDKDKKNMVIVGVEKIGILIAYAPMTSGKVGAASVVKALRSQSALVAGSHSASDYDQVAPCSDAIARAIAHCGIFCEGLSPWPLSGEDLLVGVKK